MDRLKWVFELIDKMSGPASKAGVSLKNLGGALQGTAQSSLHLDASANQLQGGLGVLSKATSSAFGPLDQAGSILKQAATYLTGLALALGVATTAFVDYGIEQAKFQENTILSFKVMSGLGLNNDTSQKYSEGKFRRAVAFGQYSPLDSKDVVSGFKQLGSNFSDKQTEDLLAAVSDTMSLSGGGKAQAEGLMQVINHVKSLPNPNQIIIRELTTWTRDAGIGMKQLGESAAKMKGLKGGDAGMSLLHGGQLTGDEVLQALVMSIVDKTGMQVGKFSATQVTTLQGAIINLKGRAEELFLTVDNLSSLKGVRQLKDAIDNTSGALMTLDGQQRKTSGSGRMLQDSVVGAFDKILQAVAGDELFQGDKPQKMVEALAVGFGMLGDVVSVMAKGVMGFIDGLMTGLGLGKDFMGGPFNPQKVEDLGRMFRELGRVLGDLAAKFIKAFTPVFDFFDKLLNTDWSASGLLKHLGGGLLDLGKTGMMSAIDPLGIASSLKDSIFGPAEPVAAGGDQSKTQTNNITVNYAVGTAQDHVDAANDMADKVARRVPSHLNF